jgi:hypothetical protein
MKSLVTGNGHLRDIPVVGGVQGARSYSGEREDHRTFASGMKDFEWSAGGANDNE